MLMNINKSKCFGTPRFFFYMGLLTIGQTIFRPALSFTLSDWFFLISFFLATSECLLRRNLEIRFPLFMIWGLLFFMVGGIISSAFANLPLMSLVALVKYLYLIAVWFWLGTVLLQTPAQVQTSIILWTSSAALSGLGALFQLFWYDIIPVANHAWGRMPGFTEHVNDLGGLTSISLIPAIMILTLPRKNIWLIVHSWLCVFLIAAGLLLSVSMSGISALIVSILVWLVLNKFPLKNMLILGISAGFFFTSIYIQSHYEGVSFLTRLTDISDDGLSSVTLRTRLETFSVAWEVIKDNPLMGVGLGPDVSLTRTGHAVHNLFMLNWYQSGLFGLIGILMILGAIAIEAYKGMRDPRQEQERTIGIALFSSYISFIVLGIAQPIFYNRFGWISAALLLSLYSVRNRSAKWKRLYNTSYRTHSAHKLKYIGHPSVFTEKRM